MSFHFTSLAHVSLGEMRMVCNHLGCNLPQRAEDGLAWYVTYKEVRAITDRARMLMAGWDFLDPNRIQQISYQDLLVLQVARIIADDASSYIYKAGLEAPRNQKRRDFLRKATRKYRLIFA